MPTIHQPCSFVKKTMRVIMEDSDFLKNFGAYIRLKRTEKGLSITEFANLVETDPAFVSRVERGLKDIKLTTAIRFINALGLPTPDFFKQ